MPANLNALIRYKQIDLCLRDPKINATIPILKKRSLAALTLYRGITDISERTIREDIRVMRSEYMGFNAPIVVKNGIYTYKDEDYSIFNTTISEMNLLKKVTELLINERDHIKSEKIEGLLAELSNITGIEIHKDQPLEIVSSNMTVHHLEENISYTEFMPDGVFGFSGKPISKKFKKQKEGTIFRNRVSEKQANVNFSLSNEEKIYYWENIFAVL